MKYRTFKLFCSYPDGELYSFYLRFEKRNNIFSLYVSCIKYFIEHCKGCMLYGIALSNEKYIFNHIKELKIIYV